MKMKLFCFLLVASVTAFAQGHGRPSGAGGGSMGGGMGHSSMGSPHTSMGSGHANNATAPKSGSQMGKQSPDTILSRNTKLSSNLEKLLPEGTTAQQACSGFKNLGQCVAAIHVANNLKIPFDDLKSKMTGTDPEKLGKAIQDLKPAADAKAEAKKANKQAEADLNDSNS